LTTSSNRQDEYRIYSISKQRRAEVKINLAHLSIQLNDLPDEILMMILKKLHNSDVLYSLIGVDKRLDTIVKDSIFTNNLILTTSFNGLNQFTDTIADRFCLEILPKINTRIQWLSVESSSMERILLATNYPNLHGLGIYNVPSETARKLFIGNDIFYASKDSFYNDNLSECI
jgi:hypothetical protein